MNLNQNGENQNARGPNELLPFEAHRDYDVSIVSGPLRKNKVKSIHELAGTDIGALVALKAIVLRATDVKPELVIATYACDNCGCENYSHVMDGVHKPLDTCRSTKCKENNFNGKLQFLPGHSKFRSYQELKVQETPDQIEMGAIPKSMTIRLKGNHVNSAAPGDIIMV